MTEPRSRSWLKLLRLPNVFTAAADVLMGLLVTRGDLAPWYYAATLVSASCLLYLSGMVLNDLFDIEVDTRDRPDRPLPSGRIPWRQAFGVGWGMWVGGVALGWLASWLASDLRPGVAASLVGISVLLYDGVLKQTPIAPLAMGACRVFNVLLGMSLGATGLGKLSSWGVGWSRGEWLIALGIGIYITGVTWFARTEARDSSRAQLGGGLLVMLAGLALVGAAPAWEMQPAPLQVSVQGWYLLWSVLALLIARRCVLAILEPRPARVQSAVRNAVHSLIILNAAITVGYAGVFWGCAVLLLIFPTLLLTMWLDAT